MACYEIDSFILKFKTLLLAGKNANLEIKSDAGKVVMNLSVEVDVSPNPHLHHHHRHVGPARQRRRARREAERAAADNAATDDAAAEIINSEEESLDNKDNLKSAEKAAETSSIDEDTDYEIYSFHYLDKSKKSEAQDAINFIEKDLQENFKKNEVTESDQIFKIEETKIAGEGFEVKFKVKKSAIMKWLHCYRGIKLFEGNIHFHLQQIHG